MFVVLFGALAKKVAFLLSCLKSDLKNILLEKLSTFLNGSTFILLRLGLSVSLGFLWLELPNASLGQVLLLHGRFSHLHIDDWRWPESFALLLDDKLNFIILVSSVKCLFI